MDRNYPSDIAAKFVQSRIDRRRFLQGAAGAAALPLLSPGAPSGAAPAPFTALTPNAIAAAQRALHQTGGDSAEAAVAAANALDPKPEKITIAWEEALQAVEQNEFSGPLWQEQTGIQIEVIPSPYIDLFSRQVAEHMAGTGGFDILSVPPNWTPDFVGLGMIEPLDAMVDEFMNKADLDDFHPLYRELMNYDGRIYGLFDDGDVIILYYRRDLFEDPAHQDAFRAQYGSDLTVPTTWEEYDQIQAFFTERLAPEIYGGASQRAPGQVYGWFSEEFRNRGGHFFDAETMDATLNSQAGVDTLTRMVNSNRTMPPGIETWGFLEVLSAWMSGQLAMIGGTWPPIGRWSEGTTAQQLEWVPATQVAGKVGYAVMPLGHSLHNAGFILGVSTNSRNKEAAYLYLQWITSPTISLQRAMLEYSLRDPYRLSHYNSPEYRARWSNAGDYLDTLKAAADGALIDIIMPASNEYHIAMDQMVTAAQAGTAVEQALANADAAFNEITNRIGRDNQKAAYDEFLEQKGAYYE